MVCLDNQCNKNKKLNQSDNSAVEPYGTNDSRQIANQPSPPTTQQTQRLAPTKCGDSCPECYGKILGIMQGMRDGATALHVPIMRQPCVELVTKTLQSKQQFTGEVNNILEIGTAIGYSTLLFLSLCPNATVNTIDIDETRLSWAKRNFAQAGVTNRVNVFLGDAGTIVPMLSGSYDLIFLDGPKAQYKVFLPYLVKLLSSGGLLIADNVGYMGLTKQADTLPKRHKHITIAKNMAQFVSDLTTEPTLTTTLYWDVGDGMSVSQKK